MRTDKIKWTELITGILLILLGIYSLIRPVGMLTGVTVIYGLFAVITGIADITLKQYFPGSQKSADYPPHIFSGVLSGSAERLMRQLQALPSQALLIF